MYPQAHSTSGRRAFGRRALQGFGGAVNQGVGFRVKGEANGVDRQVVAALGLGVVALADLREGGLGTGLAITVDLELEDEDGIQEDEDEVWPGGSLLALEADLRGGKARTQEAVEQAQIGGFSDLGSLGGAVGKVGVEDLEVREELREIARSQGPNRLAKP